MTHEGNDPAAAARDGVLARVPALAGDIRDRAAAAEEAQTVPQESVDALIAAGIIRILVPPRFGGYGLGLDTRFDVVREIGMADASHARCASLMIHHPHYVSRFSDEARSAPMRRFATGARRGAQPADGGPPRSRASRRGRVCRAIRICRSF